MAQGDPDPAGPLEAGAAQWTAPNSLWKWSSRTKLLRAGWIPRPWETTGGIWEADCNYLPWLGLRSSCSHPAPHKSDRWSSGQDLTNVPSVKDNTSVSQHRSCIFPGHEHHFTSCPATPSVPQHSCPRRGAANPGRKLCHHPCGDNAVTHPKAQL